MVKGFIELPANKIHLIADTDGKQIRLYCGKVEGEIGKSVRGEAYVKVLTPEEARDLAKQLCFIADKC